MAFESKSQERKKKNLVFFADAYSVMMLPPKEIDLDKEACFELRFQVPDVRLAMKVAVSEVLVQPLFPANASHVYNIQSVKKVDHTMMIAWYEDLADPVNNESDQYTEPHQWLFVDLDVVFQ